MSRSQHQHAAGAAPGGAACRAEAARILLSMLRRGRSLSEAVPADAAPLLREMVFGVARWYWRLSAWADALLDKPLRRKDADVGLLILIGLYQLSELRIPAHAAINETVEASRNLGKGWARGLINAVLRNYVRRGGDLGLDLDDEARYSHPAWLVREVRASWPEYWQRILDGNNQRPPRVLRVNRLRASREDYLETLRSAGLTARVDALSDDGVTVDGTVPIRDLPGFGEGLVSVQDSAAQWAAAALSVEPGQRVLDACSAPGGKLTHLLESCPGAGPVLAVDISGERTQMTRENLSRLGLSAELLVADAGDPAAWWDGEPFDAVLLDAPCSATGVIRRHPDIKHLRRPDDLAALTARQALLLDRLWRTLAPGGRLLYVTCSLLFQENDGQIERFLAARKDARICTVTLPAGRRSRYGWQSLPGVDGTDGFFYSLLQKNGDGLKSRGDGQAE